MICERSVVRVMILPVAICHYPKMDAIIAWISSTLIQMVKIAVTAPISSFISTTPFLFSVTTPPTSRRKSTTIMVILSSLFVGKIRLFWSMLWLK